MPELIKQGYVYLAQPPLYKIEKNKKIRLFMDMAYRMCKQLWQNIILSMLWIMQMDGLNLQQICPILSFHDRKL